MEIINVSQVDILILTMAVVGYTFIVWWVSKTLSELIIDDKETSP